MLTIAVSLVHPAQAQDPRASVAQKAARDWLALSDRGDAQGTGKSAGKRFQTALTASGWASALQKAREPMGTMISRTIMSTQFKTSFPGAPDGDYAIIAFKTRFTKKEAANETVTVEREADGAWRVIGYFIR